MSIYFRRMLEFLVIAAVFKLTSAACPNDILSYTEETTGKGYCYVVLKFWEIYHIRKNLWRNKARFPGIWDELGTWHTPKDSFGVVDAYPDAIRICAMIPRVPAKAYEVKHDELGVPRSVHYFKPDWLTIPSPDIAFRLPTPRTARHLEWLKKEILVDVYRYTAVLRVNVTTDPKIPEANRGKMWLDIKKSNSSLTSVTVGDDHYLKKQPGECGYLMRGHERYGGDKPDTGLYWVDCGEKGLEDHKAADKYVGRHNVACEFDEPVDCVQELLDICSFSTKYNACVLAGAYKTIQEPHARFGRPCLQNSTELTSFPCPEWLTEQCKQDCEFEYNDTSACFVEDYGEKYECGENDVNGTRRQSAARVVSLARYGGKPCAQNERTRYVECVCRGCSIQIPKFAVAIAIVVALQSYQI